MYLGFFFSLYNYEHFQFEAGTSDRDDSLQRVHYQHSNFFFFTATPPSVIVRTQPAVDIQLWGNLQQRIIEILWKRDLHTST